MAFGVGRGRSGSLSIALQRHPDSGHWLPISGHHLAFQFKIRDLEREGRQNEMVRLRFVRLHPPGGGAVAARPGSQTIFLTWWKDTDGEGPLRVNCGRCRPPTGLAKVPPDKAALTVAFCTGTPSGPFTEPEMASASCRCNITMVFWSSTPTAAAQLCSMSRPTSKCRRSADAPSAGGVPARGGASRFWFVPGDGKCSVGVALHFHARPLPGTMERSAPADWNAGRTERAPGSDYYPRVRAALAIDCETNDHVRITALRPRVSAL